MIETPQERVSRWLKNPLVDLADTEIREAIRALLVSEHQARDVAGGAQQRVLDLKAERDALQRRVDVAWITARDWRIRAEQAEAGSERLRRLNDDQRISDAQTYTAVLVKLKAERDALSEELGEVLFERDALRDKLSSVTEDYLKERNAATAAEAERDALRLDLAEACRGAAVLARERNEAQGERDALRAEAREHSERAQHFMRRMDKAEAALRIIAGEAQCVDNLMSNVEVARAALRDTAPAEEPEPEMWRCIECGETFDGPRVSHGLDAHAPGCTGSCDGSCPIQVECGPVERLPAPAEGPHCPHGNPPGSARDCACRTEERHWQDDADPNPGRAQAAYQAEQARVAEGTVGGVSTISPWRKP